MWKMRNENKKAQNLKKERKKKTEKPKKCERRIVKTEKSPSLLPPKQE